MITRVLPIPPPLHTTKSLSFPFLASLPSHARNVLFQDVVKRAHDDKVANVGIVTLEAYIRLCYVMGNFPWTRKVTSLGNTAMQNFQIELMSTRIFRIFMNQQNCEASFFWIVGLFDVPSSFQLWYNTCELSLKFIANISVEGFFSFIDHQAQITAQATTQQGNPKAASAHVPPINYKTMPLIISKSLCFWLSVFWPMHKTLRDRQSDWLVLLSKSYSSSTLFQSTYWDPRLLNLFPDTLGKLPQNNIRQEIPGILDTSFRDVDKNTLIAQWSKPPGLEKFLFYLFKYQLENPSGTNFPFPPGWEEIWKQITPTDHSNAHFILAVHIVNCLSLPPVHYPGIYQPPLDLIKQYTGCLIRLSTMFGYLHLPTMIHAIMDCTGSPLKDFIVQHMIRFFLIEEPSFYNTYAHNITSTVEHWKEVTSDKIKLNTTSTKVKYPLPQNFPAPFSSPYFSLLPTLDYVIFRLIQMGWTTQFLGIVNIYQILYRHHQYPIRLARTSLYFAYNYFHESGDLVKFNVFSSGILKLLDPMMLSPLMKEKLLNLESWMQANSSNIDAALGLLPQSFQHELPWGDYLYASLIQISRVHSQTDLHAEDISNLGATHGGVYGDFKEFGGEGTSQFVFETAALEWTILGHNRFTLSEKHIIDHSCALGYLLAALPSPFHNVLYDSLKIAMDSGNFGGIDISFSSTLPFMEVNGLFSTFHTNLMTPIGRFISVFHSFFQEASQRTFTQFVNVFEECTTKITSVSHLYFLVRIVAPFVHKLKHNTSIKMLLLLFKSLYYITPLIGNLLEDNLEADRDNCLLDMIIDYLTSLGRATVVRSDTHLELMRIISSLHIFIGGRLASLELKLVT
eukprot:TRINITY_DN11450_c0_g1_i1.p1 TRINITY_DN11450_c0_g1~~TRINITY_DN11450_c0_g1_i1.p1  ORF type:complete len:970 (+),score=120.85 TRINITY_DN11450_c0_g1_i1:363-2912(+)